MRSPFMYFNPAEKAHRDKDDALMSYFLLTVTSHRPTGSAAGSLS